ncbi:TPA: hypothetical protein DCZ46_00585 [Candidatus Campbellbacteria bacterium]|nr:MAG: Pili subunit [Candidatus Campbellbacteria bacterium GW2011_OD1_34_28]KKP75416.1 MAG: hypothetical protein UR74_C0001G0272 [Candidatus Campbellbacteria bacterium GW2011_GWD2_35_24]KKP76023.1 MAG: hypothetical protein UR75_C0001G0057 [Candidatus Campbellbacteria bacterium GW2011_GWC2_35_28]KKP77212.1 MAG: hypothetical protein UR76_C0001G0057 [Candidatus Campbellbacteria bacterium GW2011_GWC1_35_31]KKP79141.1 MAG: hypothetical protein UR79_C0001G0057 [Candidatus Campbellbacteria bacterium 
MFFLKTKNLKLLTKRAFSLIELLVVLAIITLITSIVLINHSVFNGGVVLESLAYEIALITRQAQFFSINVLGSNSGGTTTFDTGYGMYFTTDPLNSNNKQFILFADIDDNSFYDDESELVEVYNITRGNIIKDICINGNSICDRGQAHVTFKRPDPDAIIKTDSPADCGDGCSYVDIYVGSSNPRIKDKIIRISITGQISISTSQIE